MSMTNALTNGIAPNRDSFNFPFLNRGLDELCGGK
jgi:hypothetical protein